MDTGFKKESKMEMTGLSLRQLHQAHQPLVSPFAHDALSARLIEQAGFKSFNIGGLPLLAARHALPDVGIGGLGEMLSGLRDIREASKLPCLMDGDDGYGDVKSITRTIQSYEIAGAAGVLLEDQTRAGKQPGAGSAGNVVPLRSMEQKLRAAMAARRSSDFIIIARTDALAALGLDEALRRAERYLSIGADGIFVAGLKTREHYVHVGEAFKGSWNTAAIFEGTATPWLVPSELHCMGFSQIFYPNILIGRVAKAIEQGLGRLHRLAAGDKDAFTAGAQELALKGLADALELDNWNGLETKFSS
jgi:2-methylisocitrate lyase-like PEP mutase family enzyme